MQKNDNMNCMVIVITRIVSPICVGGRMSRKIRVIDCNWYYWNSDSSNMSTYLTCLFICMAAFSSPSTTESQSKGMTTPKI